MPRAGSSNDGGAPAGGDSRIDRLKTEVAEAQDVMRNNINLVREREDNLQNLQDKTGSCYFYLFYGVPKYPSIRKSVIGGELPLLETPG